MGTSAQIPGYSTRLEAARVLASIAPRQSEGTLLSFAGDREFSRYAPLALHRLHTKRSLAALRDLVLKSAPGTSENLEAAKYLAEDGGKSWSPVLREAANRHPDVGYLVYEAEAEGDGIIEELRGLVPGPERHLEAVEALGWTASRRAIPILLDQLENTDPITSDRADGSLRVLTHRIAHSDSGQQDQHARYLEWSRWWKQDGNRAKIFKPNECGIEQVIERLSGSRHAQSFALGSD